MFSFFLLALETAMLGVFVSLDLFLFYVFWDAMLIPMYFLIGVWGYERRIYAAVKFILYTMAGSVLMLVAIIGLAYAHAATTGQPSFNLLGSLRPAPVAFDGDVVLPRLHGRVRHQGPAVPVSHLAARRARRGADSGLGHPGRRPAQDGHLRTAAVLLSALSERGCRVDAGAGRARGDRDRLRRAGRDGPAGHEEAGRLLQRQPSRVRRARPVRAECQRRTGRRLPDAESRGQHRRTLHARRHALRPATYTTDFGVRRAQGRDASVGGRVPPHHALLDRACQV